MAWLVGKLDPRLRVIRSGDVTLAVKLAQEIYDLLGICHVGLYEFTEILRDMNRWMTPRRRSRCARLALEGLLAQPDTRLVLVRWPRSDVIDVLTLSGLPVDAWSAPGADGLYVAVDQQGGPSAERKPPVIAASTRRERAYRPRPWADLLPDPQPA